MPNQHDEKSLTMFENFRVRRHYDKKTETWFFSVIDIIAVLTEQRDYLTAKTYWTTLKNRLKMEGSEVVTNCDRLKMLAIDGKLRETDVANVETILRLIQSVPSKKAEPIKLWLAKVGYERMQEVIDPERALNRSREYWQRMGRSESWIQQRMMGQEIRNKLTDYWQNNEVKTEKEFAILTNIIHQEWSDLSVKEHKNLKNLQNHNLRDHFTEAEMVFTALAELSTRQISETLQTKGLVENKIPAKQGGRIAKDARIALEKRTGKKVVTGKNFLPSKKENNFLKDKN
ncbi:MAG: hypothetical protein WCT18_00510 [Patescibacteria group bacterium]